MFYSNKKPPKEHFDKKMGKYRKISTAELRNCARGGCRGAASELKVTQYHGGAVGVGQIGPDIPGNFREKFGICWEVLRNFGKN